MKYTTRLLIIFSTLTGGVLHKTACAATMAKLSVSAIVETRCAIKVVPNQNQQTSNVKSDCSDNTAATITLARPAQTTPAPATPQGTVSGIGTAEVTVTY